MRNIFIRAILLYKKGVRTALPVTLEFCNVSLCIKSTLLFTYAYYIDKSFVLLRFPLQIGNKLHIFHAITSTILFAYEQRFMRVHFLYLFYP